MAKIAENSVTPAAVAAVLDETDDVIPEPLKISLTRLLVVDDEDFVRDLLGEILEGENCEVHLAESGSEALSLFRENEFDGVFTDVGMPGMSGWELAREIRLIDQRIPIAVITGWGEAVGSHEKKAAGVDWVVAKPFTADRIVELVRDVESARQKAVATAAA